MTIDVKVAEKWDFSAYRTEVTTIRFSQTIVDASIQRGVVEREVNKIASDFNPSALHFITISVRDDGSYVLVDGQQRKTAALVVGYDEPVNAIFYYNLPREAEAALFRQLNDRTSVNAVDSFRVAVVEGLPEAVAVYTVFKDYGIGVKGLVPGKIQFQGVKSALRIVGLPDGINDLRWAFDMAVYAWGSTEIPYYDCRVIEALAIIKSHYRTIGVEIDSEALRKKLAGYKGAQAGLVGNAKTVQMIRRGRLARRIADVIVGIYNQNRTGKASELPELPK